MDAQQQLFGLMTVAEENQKTVKARIDGQPQAQAVIVRRAPRLLPWPHALFEAGDDSGGDAGIDVGAGLSVVVLLLRGWVHGVRMNPCPSAKPG